jgi:hypothetical protein
VQSTTIDEDLGIATSMVTFSRSVGQAFGVAIGGTVFQNQFNRYLNQAVAADAMPHELIVTGAQAAGAYHAIGNFPVVVQTAYRYIYADSLRVVWYATTGIAGMGLIASVDRGNNAKQAFKNEKRRGTWRLCEVRMTFKTKRGCR